MERGRNFQFLAVRPIQVVKLNVTKMKKLLFVFALMCGAMFTSCGNTAKNAEQTDSVKVDTVVVDSTDTVSADTLAVDSVK